jgi:nitrite reductase/ring-hydroxylating ferredoxin subunit/uncharacterized membrane protein
MQPETRQKRLDVAGRRFVGWWEEQEALDKVAEKVSELVRKEEQLLPGGQKTVDFLHGKYIGHPLHPILTDLPIGAFTFAAMFDMLSIGRKKPSKAATTLLAVGLASVPVTALAGSLDWRHTYGKTKRVGLGHAVMNGAGSVILAMSLLTRLRGRGPTRMLNFLGNGFLTFSAYMGGHLVYEARVGTKHEAEASPPEHFIPVMPAADLQEQKLTRVEAGGFPIALYKRFGQVYAVADVCPHLGCSLAQGSVDAEAVVCGCHGSRFDLNDGAVLEGPSAFPTDAYLTRVVNGTIEVAPMQGVSR